MSDFGWDVLDWDVPGNFNGSNAKILSCCLYGIDVIILYQERITLIFQFMSKNYVFSPPCIKSIESREKIINVIDVLERIYMFDDSGALFELVQDSDGWSWKWVQHLDKGLAVIGLNNGLAFLRQIEKMTFIEFYKLNMDEFELESSKKVNYSQISTEPYQLITIRTNEIKLLIRKLFRRSDVGEVLFIDDPLGFTYAIPINSNPLNINFEKDSLISVLPYKNQNSILLIYHSGRVILIECEDSITNNVLFLCEKVSSITWYDHEKTTLIWSDGIDLHLSKITNPTEITDLQINRNIKGVCHVINFHDDILVVTENNIFYNIKRNNEVLSNPIVNKKSGEILKEIYDVGMLIEKLNEDIKHREEVIYALESSKTENIGKKFKLTIKGKELNIKNESGRLFKKNLWVIKLETCDKNKKLVEIKKFENDFNDGMSINIETNFTFHNFLFCSLVCDIGNDFKLIGINLPKMEKSERIDMFDRKLLEITKKRNQSSINKFK